MSVRVCEDDNEKLIYINSEFRSAGHIADYTIQLDKNIKNVEYIEMIDTTVEYSDIVFRKGAMQFTITRYNIEPIDEVNTLVETACLSKEFHPYVHNNVQAIHDFNDLFDNIAIMTSSSGEIHDDFGYVDLKINDAIMKENDVVVITDHNGFFSNYCQIPYQQIIVAKPTKTINNITISVMGFIKNLTTSTPIPYNYIHYISQEGDLNLTSREAFLLTKYKNPNIPMKDQQYSEPLHNRSIGMYLETINGTNIDLVNTNGGVFNNCFYVHDNTSQRIRNIATAALSVMGISSVARELPHIHFKFNTPTNINGFRVRLVFSDGTPYAVNEMNQTGKSTILLKVHCKTGQ